MSVLGIDTSTPVCGVAIISDGELLASACIAVQRAHAEQLLPLIQACIAGAGEEGTRIGAVAVASGPGSFTGLRIGFSTAKGICLARGAALVAVPTFDAWAWSAVKESGLPVGSSIVAVMKAGRGDAYAGTYRCSENGAVSEGVPAAYPFGDLAALAESKAPVGPGDRLLILAEDPALAASWFPGVPPAAIAAAGVNGNPAVGVAMLGEKMFRAGATADLRYAEPAYVKDFSYTLKNEQGA